MSAVKVGRIWSNMIKGNINHIPSSDQFPNVLGVIHLTYLSYDSTDRPGVPRSYHRFYIIIVLHVHAEQGIVRLLRPPAPTVNGQSLNVHASPLLRHPWPIYYMLNSNFSLYFGISLDLNIYLFMNMTARESNNPPQNTPRDTPIDTTMSIP